MYMDDSIENDELVITKLRHNNRSVSLEVEQLRKQVQSLPKRPQSLLNKIELEPKNLILR